MESPKSRNWHIEKIRDEKIGSYLSYILAYQSKQLLWYEKQKTKRRLFSEILLTLAVIFFAGSLIAPLLPGIWLDKIEKNDIGLFYGSGYLFLIGTTIILLTDRLFGHSNNWIRFTLTYLQLDTITSEFYGKWLEIVHKLDDPSISDDTRMVAIKLLQKFDTSLKSIVTTESENWRELFTSQIQDFSKKVESRLKDVKQEISDYKETTQKELVNYDKVILKIEFNQIPKDFSIEINVFLDSKNTISKLLNSFESTWVLMDISPGQYKMEYVIMHKNNKVKKVIEILGVTGDTQTKKLEYAINYDEIVN